MKNCICIVCYEANYVWVEFLSEVKNYDVYIIIDDNISDYYDHMFSDYKNVNLVRIKDEDCYVNGYKNMNFTVRKEITGWEKAIYYFSNINTVYDNIWFVEDDVFFNSEKTLMDIDAKYISSDLLTNSYNENETGSKNYWNWKVINIEFPPPYYSAMCCAVRMSNNMLLKIKEYANNYKTLFFIEALLPTLCKKANLIYDTPDELQNIISTKNYNDDEIDTKNLFHPVKDMIKHVDYRTLLNQ
jgi:hypothetical protein